MSPIGRAGQAPTAQQLALELPSETGWCQRWHARQPSWLRTGEGGFDPGAYRCVELPEAPARRFVEAHHYSASWPSVSMAFGLQRVDEAPGAGEPAGGRLYGVLTLGVPMNAAVLTRVFPTLAVYRQSLELNRLVLLDRAESNAESWFCARAFALAAARGVRGVVAHSDPQARTRLTPDGPQLVSPGHVGHVYAVQGFAYLGRTRMRRLTVLPDASVLSDRAASKVRRGEVGHLGVEQRLIGFGARPRRPGEDGGRWLAEALEAAGAASVLHRGNHRFARSIGPHRTRVRLASTALDRPTRADI